GRGLAGAARPAGARQPPCPGRACPRPAPRAHVPLPAGSENGAPPQFTTNGQSCGGSLEPGSEAVYAHYLAGVVKRIHDHDHITLRYVSPMNEPDNSFESCGQEGMQVAVEQRALVVQELGKELTRRAPYAKVIADETT